MDIVFVALLDLDLFGIGGFVIAGVIVAVFVVLFVPKIQIRLALGSKESKTRKDLGADKEFQLEDEARKTWSQIVGGLAILIGFIFTYQTVVASQQAQETARKTQFSNSFATATDDLGASDMEARLGGIYALERLAEDSSLDNDSKQVRQVIEVLSAYVRKHAPTGAETQLLPSKARAPDPPPKPPETDIQAILTVLGRQMRTPENPREELYTYPLYQSDLRFADLVSADLSRASLWKTNLQGAKLDDANLQGAYLGETNLQGTSLLRTDLKNARLPGADLRLATGLNKQQLEETKSGDQTTLLPADLEPPLHWGEKLDIPVQISLPPKEYCPEEFGPVQSFRVDEGWTSLGQGGDHLYLAHGDSRLNFVVPRSAYDPEEPTETVHSPEGTEHLLSWLREHPSLDTEEPVATTVGEVSGKRIDTTADAPPGVGFLECVDPCVPLFKTDGKGRLVSFEGHKTRTFVLKVQDEALIVTLASPAGDFEQFLPQAMGVLETVKWQY